MLRRVFPRLSRSQRISTVAGRGLLETHDAAPGQWASELGGKGADALLVCAMQGDEDGVLEALRWRVDPNAREGRHGLTALHFCAVDGSDRAVRPAARPCSGIVFRGSSRFRGQ